MIVNPMYEFKNSEIWPSLFTQCFTLWSGLYLRYQINDHTFEESKMEINKLIESNKQAKLNIEIFKK